MTITDQLYTVNCNGYGYVSHLFTQFILTNSRRMVTPNHGDGYPRNAVIMQFGNPAGMSPTTFAPNSPCPEPRL